MTHSPTIPWVIIGAGPAGLTAAFTLSKLGQNPTIFEMSHYVGGISRTHVWNGNRIDIGGHRFFTKNEDVKKFWDEMLDEPMIKVNRLSRIYYQGRFFHYPLQIINTIVNLGIIESALMVASYVRAQFKKELPEDSFEQWVRNRFGDRLYRTFFKTYTEKVWGISCNEIRADWAAQRIHGLNFLTAVMNALRNTGRVKSLIKTFDYPRLGPGMLWESCARKIKEQGGQLQTGCRVSRIFHDNGTVKEIEFEIDGKRHLSDVGNVISTMPLSELANVLDPAPPQHVLDAANGLKYRDFLIVALTCNNADLFPDNWLYIHSPDVRVGRIQNFRNWSKDLVAPETGTTLGMEYFCSRNDDLWNMSDNALIAQAKIELSILGLVQDHDLVEGYVIRELNAYPVYDSAYREHVNVLCEYFSNSFNNLQTAGRNALHRYNNQDHSMLAGQHAAMRLLGNVEFDPWSVNTERSYYEEQLISNERIQSAQDILLSDTSPHRETI